MDNRINIAIYGLGQETEKNIERLERIYNIVGLLDSYETTGELYGYPIIDIDSAIEEYNIQKIIVIARPGSCRAIANKIGTKCVNSNIELVDINNNSLLKKAQVKYNLHGIDGYSIKQFRELANAVDVVSFDLFDTLITRLVPNRECLFELIANKHKENSLDVDSFVHKRLEAEIVLSRETVPYLTEIYKHIYPNASEELLKKYVLTEYETELSVLVQRTDMAELLDEVYKLGKQVFITTDTYYSESMIHKILDKCNINTPVTVITSCDNSTSKIQSLFEVLAKRAKTKSVLHIGDDMKADIESAKAHGINTFHIYSPIDYYNMVGELGLEEYINSLSDKIRVGMLIAKVFNKAFLFEEGNEISIDSLEMLGYTFLAPVLYDYVEWIGKQADNEANANLIFSARDGYLLQKLFSMRWTRESSYLLTSRISAIRAGIECEEDIQEIEKTSYTGSLHERIKTRYGLDISDDYIEDGVKSGVLKYAEHIIEAAKEKKKNYLEYISKNISVNDDSILFVDMTAKGTIHKYLEKIITRKMHGLYFLQLEPEFANKNGIIIDTFWNINNSLGQSVFDDFYILEPIISSRDSTLEEFDINGSPIFAAEDRTEAEMRAMDETQAGIFEYTAEYLSICPTSEIMINQELDERIFKLIHKFKINAQEFYCIRNIDSFVNRSTHIDVEV